eukprot:Lithocolla_globosa_v1_NODE_5846_length_1176_cov_69.884924.p2 type:complete len:109 gc:universal NODE_5846_length_1176_cov_69.884924:576-250(-)
MGPPQMTTLLTHLSTPMTYPLMILVRISLIPVFIRTGKGKKVVFIVGPVRVWAVVIRKRFVPRVNAAHSTGIAAPLLPTAVKGAPGAPVRDSLKKTSPLLRLTKMTLA